MSGASALVVVAAGSSARMGGIDKVWASLGDYPVIWWSLKRLAACVDECVLVVGADRVREAHTLAGTHFPAVRIVVGGHRRQDSVYRGLEALPEVDRIAVHDAARPFAPFQLLHAGFDQLGSVEGAVPVEAVTDTLKRVDSAGVVTGTVDRAELRACQTPQVFRADALRRAHRSALLSGAVATDDAALLELAGGHVGTFPGHWTNLKITTERDLWLARLLLEHGQVELPCE